MGFTMVYWTDSYGASRATRVFTEHVAAFTADVKEVGGEVFKTESDD